MSDVIGQCSACRGDVTHSQRVDYLGDHIRHGNRSDCVRPLQAEIDRLTREVERLREAVSNALDDVLSDEAMPAHKVALLRAALSGGEHE